MTVYEQKDGDMQAITKNVPTTQTRGELMSTQASLTGNPALRSRPVMRLFMIAALLGLFFSAPAFAAIEQVAFYVGGLTVYPTTSEHGDITIEWDNARSNVHQYYKETCPDGGFYILGESPHASVAYATLLAAYTANKRVQVYYYTPDVRPYWRGGYKFCQVQRVRVFAE